MPYFIFLLTIELGRTKPVRTTLYFVKTGLDMVLWRGWRFGRWVIAILRLVRLLLCIRRLVFSPPFEEPDRGSNDGQGDDATDNAAGDGAYVRSSISIRLRGGRGRAALAVGGRCA